MRQGKLSELIHNSGVVVNDESVPPPSSSADADGAEFEDSDEYDSDAGAGKKGKKGGKKSKAKRASVVNEAGMIQSCTVEVWFREIIDLVSHAQCDWRAAQWN